MLNEREIYYGKDEAIPEMVTLHAGPLTMEYDKGDLRYIRYGEHELVRRLYSAVRNQNWDTIAPVLSDVNIQEGADSFRVTYTATHQQDAVHFVWQATIEGTSDGVVTFSMDGEAKNTFLRNRIGFCILHPMGLAGEPMTVEHPDGSTEKTDFPTDISPHQPVMDMQAIRHEAGNGAQVEIRFEGDIFEMEDQRNWTDASYKTYCTPLALPFPVEVKAGQKIHQSVTVRLEGASETAITDDDSGALAFNVSADTQDLPPIGFSMASHGEPLTEQEITRLKALNPAHLRVDLRGDTMEADFRQAAQLAGAVGAALEVAVHLSNNAESELKALRALVDELKPNVSAYLIFREGEKSTSAQWVQMAREHLDGAPIGGGTDAFFTELNRERPDTSVMGCTVFSINPQVHAFDNVDLTETLEAQRTNLETAHGFSGGKPVIVSPITLKMRWNPNATGPEPETPPGELPPQVDTRQMSLYGAGWTLGSIKYMAEGKAHSTTYYETTGMRGVMSTAAGSPLPDKFPALPGAVYPMYHVFADVGEFADGHAHTTRSQNPLAVNGLALHQDNKLRVMLANLTGKEQRVQVTGMSGEVVVKSLDGDNAQHAMNEPEAFRRGAGETLIGDELLLTLKPYAVVRIDGERE